MNKNNLHTAMLVALRGDPRLYTVFRDVSVEDSYHSGLLTDFDGGHIISLDEYNNDLTHKTNPGFDIMKVYIKTELTFSHTEPVQIKLVYEVPPIEHMSFKDALLVDGRIKPNMENIPSGFEFFQPPRIVLSKLKVANPDSYRNLILADWFVHRAGGKI